MVRCDRNITPTVKKKYLDNVTLLDLKEKQLCLRLATEQPDKDNKEKVAETFKN